MAVGYIALITKRGPVVEQVSPVFRGVAPAAAGDIAEL